MILKSAVVYSTVYDTMKGLHMSTASNYVRCNKNEIGSLRCIAGTYFGSSRQFAGYIGRYLDTPHFIDVSNKVFTPRKVCDGGRQPTTTVIISKYHTLDRESLFVGNIFNTNTSSMQFACIQ